MEPVTNSSHHPTGHPDDGSERPGGQRGLALLCAVILAVLIAVGAVPRLRRHGSLKAAATAAVTAPPLVNTVSPLGAPGITSIALPGNVQAMDETTINAQTSGYVRKYYVDIGSHVHAGQLLAVIESPEVDQQMLAAQADVEKSRAAFGQSEADVSRLQAGVAQAGAATVAGRAKVQQARADVTSMQAKELQAQSAISTAQSGLARAHEVLAQRESEQARAGVALALAQRTLNRWLELGKVNAVAGQEVDEKQADYDSARDNLDAAKAAVVSARDDIASNRSQIASAQADARAAAADVAAARQQVEADLAAWQSEQAGVAAARADVTAGRQNVHASQATIRSTQAKARQYGAMQGFQRIVAPFEGVITARNIDVGTLVTAGVAPGKEQDPTRTVPQSGLFGIARIDTLRIQANVPQSFVAYLHDGQTADITVPDFPGRVFSGKILVMSGALDAGSRTMMVEVRVDNRTGELIPGMYARIKFVGKRTTPALIVPANTLIVDAVGTRVATVTAANTVHFEPVQIGTDLGSSVEISTGLSGRERLITDPGDDLSEGQPVEVAIPERAGQPGKGAAAS